MGGDGNSVSCLERISTYGVVGAIVGTTVGASKEALKATSMATGGTPKMGKLVIRRHTLIFSCIICIIHIFNYFSLRSYDSNPIFIFLSLSFFLLPI